MTFLQYGPKIFSSNSAVLAMFVICLTTQFYLVIANVVLFSFADPPPIRVEETVIKDRVNIFLLPKRVGVLYR